MSKRLLILLCITILAGAGLVIIALRFDPYQSESGIIFLFLSSLFAFIWGLGSIMFFTLHLLSNNRWQDSFRRGLLLAIFVVTLILFRINDIFYWYLALGLGIVLVFAEVLIGWRLNKETHDKK